MHGDPTSGIRPPTSEALSLKSPDGHIAIETLTDNQAKLRYRVTRDGIVVVDASDAGIVVDGANLTDGVGFRFMVPDSGLSRRSGVAAKADTRTPFFDLCRRNGVVGAKIDFFDHEARETIDLYDAILSEAAQHHVMVDFHGANKPTGGDRTWPNELTREAVYGFEHRATAPWRTHNTTLPFTRFLAGSAVLARLVSQPGSDPDLRFAVASGARANSAYPFGRQK